MSKSERVKVPKLISELESPDEFVRLKAIEQLMAIGAPAEGAFPALLQACVDYDGDTRAAALDAGAQIADDIEPEDAELWYDLSQICQNGHVVNSMAFSKAVRNAKFCKQCGEPTTSVCSNCGTAIKGFDHMRVAVVSRRYTPPYFCPDCGKPYPWTESRLKAARELADDAEGLKESERIMLQKSLDDIVRDTPRTPVAAGRFKRLVAKAGKETAGAFKDLLTDVMSETAKKMIYGSGS